MLTEAELREIKERVDAATAGPWCWRKLGEHESLFADHGRRDVIMTDGRTRNERGVLVRAKAGMANPDFIAHARTDVPRLLDEIDMLKAERDEFMHLATDRSNAMVLARRERDEARADAAAVLSAVGAYLQALDQWRSLGIFGRENAKSYQAYEDVEPRFTASEKALRNITAAQPGPGAALLEKVRNLQDQATALCDALNPLTEPDWTMIGFLRGQVRNAIAAWKGETNA